MRTCSCENSPLCLPQRPTRPLPIPNPKRKLVPDACLSTVSSGGEHKVTPSAPPIQKAEGIACSRSGLHNGQGVPVTDTPRPGGTRLVQDAKNSVRQTHNKPPLVQDAKSSVQQTHSKPRSFFGTNGLGHPRKPQAQAKLPAGNSPSIPRPAAKSVCQHSNLSIKTPGKRAAPTSKHRCKKARKEPRLSPCPSPQESMQRADPQPQQESPLAKTLQPSKEPQNPATPRSPIKMVFKRSKEGQWSCYLVPSPSIPPVENSFFSDPPHPGEERGTWSQGPLCVLQEDLQLSSSSAESDDGQ